MDKTTIIDALISVMVLPFFLLLYWLSGGEFERNHYLAITVFAGVGFSFALFLQVRFYRKYGL